MKQSTLHQTEPCRRISDILSRIGDKWSLLVIRQLGDGPLRFSQIKRSLGSISQKMLTATLRGLERDGFVSRTVFPTVPPRVDYELTLARPRPAGAGQGTGRLGDEERRAHRTRAQALRRGGDQEDSAA